MSTPYDGDTAIEIRDRVRRVEMKLTNFIKALGFAPSERANVVVEHNVGVTEGGALVASSAAVPIGNLFLAAQVHNLRGSVPVYVGDRYFGDMLTTRE
jgi:hypothetical protein